MSYPPALWKRALRRALHAGLAEAKRHLLMINVMDSDRPEALFFPIDGSRHVGDPQHVVDAAVLDAIENILRADFPLIRVVGEESIRSIRSREYPVAMVDPVDGTKPFTHIGVAWAVVIILLEPCDESPHLWIPAAGIATSSGVLVSILEEQNVYIELLDGESCCRALTACDDPGDDLLSLACVAAKASDAPRLEILRSAFPKAMLFNTGGNPVVMGVLTGDLSGIVAFEPQCCWDAAYALAVSLADGTVGTLDGRIFDRAEVLAWFRRPLQGAETEMKVVPPIVAAKNRNLYMDIVAGLRNFIGTAGLSASHGR